MCVINPSLAFGYCRWLSFNIVIIIMTMMMIIMIILII